VELKRSDTAKWGETECKMGTGDTVRDNHHTLVGPIEDPES